MGRIERTRRRGRRARYARSHAVASHNPSLRQGPKVSLRSAPGGPATYQTASNGSLSSQAHYEKLRSFQLRARLRDAAEGPRSTMAAPRGYWLTAKGHCTSRQLVATRKGPAPMGILRTHNKPQLLRPHRQVFSASRLRQGGPRLRRYAHGGSAECSFGLLCYLLIKDLSEGVPPPPAPAGNC